ncbi:unnamed protein product [Orchesella dallaii]|uniref:Strictosidine synthase conserved region domain-containing protein n=1 Tax=Orchesella dallaii TaxID=48710 RepID=A0ABP1RV77_9HEXA
MGVNIVLKFIAIIIASVVLLLNFPGLPPTQEFTAFHVEPPKKLEGWMASNSILDQAELYYEGPHVGIESMVVLDDNNIITGDLSGALFRIIGKQKAVNITHLEYPCSVEEPHVNSDHERKCGWPLGMRLDNSGNLLTMDYFGGLTKVNLKTGKYENLVPKHVPIEGKIGHVPEDVHMAKDGSIYFSDGNTNPSGDFNEELIGQPSGRLLKYDPVKNSVEVLLDDLHFSNGIFLVDDESFILVSEYGRTGVRRYYLKGEKKGQSDYFVDGLPGYPDNIRSNGRDGFFMPLYEPWNEQFSMRNHVLSSYPLLRKLVFRIRFLLLTILRQALNLLPNNAYLIDLESYIKGYGPLLKTLQGPKVATVVELSKSGDIIGVFYGIKGDITELSQFSVGKEYGYMVSPSNNKVWRIRLEELKGQL